MSNGGFTYSCSAPSSIEVPPFCPFDLVEVHL